MDRIDPEMSAAERAELNRDVARTDATGFRDHAKCQDFEYLCRAADAAGWIVGIGVSTDYLDAPRDGYPGRRALRSLRCGPKGGGWAFSVAIEDNLARASRKALDQLLGRAGKK